ncbi:MAG: small ribosomal subunit biogenesis GTPase RsgA [Pseudomonadota bacterium]
MSGRRLTRQQRERVQAQQTRRIERLAARDDSDDAQLGPEEEGTVITRFGSHIDVETADRSAILRCRLRTNLDNPVSGDRVVWRRSPSRVEGEADGGVVVALLPRRSELQRPDNYGKLKTVAANIDHAIVVFAPLPAPSSALLDRYLAAAEHSRLSPVLLLNKSDLTATPGHAEAERLTALYRRTGYRVLHCSSRTADGLDELRDFLRGRTCVFVGQSGVGKSSLVNALLPDAALATREVSPVSGLGQHTTTAARLFHLPTTDGTPAGDLIDSPGVREFQLWHIDEAQLEAAWIDFRPWQGQCRFRDCRHLKEPGCALRAAAERGELATERLENFLRIRDSLRDAPDIRP